MSTVHKTIDDITRTKTALTGDERVPGRDSSGDFKITVENMISSVQSVYLAEEMKMFSVFKPISETFPWFCMSYPDQNWQTDHYSADFIAEMRTRKVIYDELDTNVSSFGGTWGAGADDNKFTLTNNTENNAMIAELAEEYLFAGSPTTNWRLLHDGTNEFNIIEISVASRYIKVNKDGKTPAGTSISIYLHRVYGSTTSARHFSWAGLGLYMTGQNKITGLRRRDKFQGHRMSPLSATGFLGGSSAGGAAFSGGTTVKCEPTTGDPITDGKNGTPRTGPKTEMESGTVLAYVFVGTYTA